MGASLKAEIAAQTRLALEIERASGIALAASKAYADGVNQDVG